MHGGPSNHGSGSLEFDNSTELPMCSLHGILQRPTVNDGKLWYSCRNCPFEDSEFTVEIEDMSTKGRWNVARRQLKRDREEKAEKILDGTGITYMSDPDWFVIRVTSEELNELSNTIYPKAKAYAQGVPEEKEDPEYKFVHGDEYHLLVSEWDAEALEHLDKEATPIEDAEVSRDYFG